MFAPIPPTELTKKQRSTLESWVRSPTKQSRAVQRARIVLAAADGVSNRQIVEGTLARYRLGSSTLSTSTMAARV